MRWWLIAAVYQLQHYSQGSERLQHFYYAKNIPGVADGGSGLMRKVMAIRSQKEQEEQKHNS
jgi:hypothetical protein